MAHKAHNPFSPKRRVTMTWLIVLICGLVIALALILLARSLRKMSRGQCCEGCGDCSQKNSCSSVHRDEQDDPRGKPGSA